jgi:type IV pilus assembly protein PilE
MITLAIVAIIATVAYPTYLNQVRKARRVEGKSLLLEAQGKQERFFTENNSYALNMSALGYGANNVVTEDSWYSVSSTPTGCAAGPALPCSGFILTAAPQNDQLNDTDCGSLGLNNFGQKTISGTETVQTCW